MTQVNKTSHTTNPVPTPQPKEASRDLLALADKTGETAMPGDAFLAQAPFSREPKTLPESGRSVSEKIPKKAAKTAMKAAAEYKNSRPHKKQRTN
jgi:hypothetical protein